MSDIEFYIPYWGPFVTEMKIDEEFVDLLREKGDESRQRGFDHRKNLAGDIEHEYYYSDFYEWFMPLMSPYVEAYLNGARNYGPALGEIAGWQMEQLWINYQGPKEYNPPHNHKADLSFVVYLQVPEEIKIEHAAVLGETSNVGPGMIVFDYGREAPFSNYRHCKLPETGDLVIFPAWLPHHTYAFKSDVERISVSGNIVLETQMNIMQSGSMPAVPADL